ncbi:hypothetical protein [Streptomyces sp. NRRL S-237]|uniref:hypothetical protein n=1 Tax=Streptomyces sp. NRRL S-237 TaxID=1463895 RepID=UPI00131E29CD|nr:hypothetical protein [Streptomyces sp. NRRL S-237]
MSDPVAMARLVGAVADAADVTVLPRGGDIARGELHAAAARVSVAADERLGADVQAELTAVRAGCRRAAVALGLSLPVFL